MPQKHIVKFWGCFPNPPQQPAVGDSPQDYLKKLNEHCGLMLTWPKSHPTGQLTRTQLRALCRDTKVDVLIAYAAVMAWGGRGVDSRNYRLSLSDRSRTALIKILTELRASKANRKDDFAAMQQAAECIKGLGISFYTKLLFFFREKPDAYILDQFTAKSAKLLFDPCPVALNSSGYPDPDNEPESYEQFCAAAEAMGAGCASSPVWTGNQVEQAMFDVRGGAWRKYLRSVYGKAGYQQGKKSRGGNSRSRLQQSSGGELLTCDSEGDSLPVRVVRAHAAAYQAGVELPGANPRVGNGTPVRVHCSLIDGVHWQYAFQQTSVHAQVFIPAQHVARYDALRAFLGAADHEFGDGIKGTGEKDGKTRSLKLTVPGGLKAPQSEWDGIAKQAVSVMGTLYNRICEYRVSLMSAKEF